MGFGRWPMRDAYYFYEATSNTTPNFAEIVNTNRTANVSTTGLTVLSGISGVDDGSAQIPNTTVNFSFFGTNYGLNQNNGMYWCTNNVLVFGGPKSTITWSATTGRGILIANSDRRTNTFYYSGGLTSGGYNYQRWVLRFQNRYSDRTPNAGQYEMRIFSNGTNQYLEVSSATTVSTAGAFNITNSTAYQPTLNQTYSTRGSFTSNTSFVLASVVPGNTWYYYHNSRVNL